MIHVFVMGIRIHIVFCYDLQEFISDMNMCVNFIVVPL